MHPGCKMPIILHPGCTLRIVHTGGAREDRAPWVHDADHFAPGVHGKHRKVKSSDTDRNLKIVHAERTLQTYETKTPSRYKLHIGKGNKVHELWELLNVLGQLN
jgi:hypothetical protein